ncbi:MAG TPA: hypothetical protein VFI05_11695, partial [Nitrospiraceae bacterium]|nr:hypothetical protein [Nitrospiraceae bacterium]
IKLLKNDFLARPQAQKAPEAYPSHPPRPEPAETVSFPVVGTLRMLLRRGRNYGKGRVSARLGQGG